MTPDTFLKAVAEPEDAEIDIVAVHGLNPLSKENHAESTWTGPNSKKLWLRDFLPAQVPKARIFLFGYNANPAFKSGNEGVYDQANNLLVKLYLERDDAPGRPIIFICHNPGGLVVKRAIVQAHSSRKYQQLLRSVYGLVFFGTPHRGGNGASLANTAVSVARAVLGNPDNNYLEALERNSFFAEAMRYDFRNRQDDFYVLTFYETKPLKTGMVVGKESAVMGLGDDRETVLGLAADHSAMCKFEDENGEDYKHVWKGIRLLAKNAVEHTQSIRALEKHAFLQRGLAVEEQTSARPSLSRNISTPLSVPTYEKGFFNASKKPVSRFVSRPGLHRLIREQLHDTIKDAERSRILVIHGLGGAGKTQLLLDYVSKYMADYQGVYWTDGTSKMSVERDFVKIYRMLFSKTSEDMKELPEIEVLVSLVHNWFKSNKGRRVLVFDGADSIINKNDSQYYDVNNFIPHDASVDVVITSRIAKVSEITPLKVHVDAMEVEEAKDLFLKGSNIDRRRMTLDQDQIMESVVKELGSLALAVTLAASLVQETPRYQKDLSRFIEKYRNHREIVLERNPDELIEAYGLNIVATWELSYESIERDFPPAAKLISALSFVNHEDIFENLFDNPLDHAVLSPAKLNLDVRSSLTKIYSYDGPLHSNNVDRGLATLRKFSLLQYSPDQDNYSMHKLVHAWAQDRLDLATWEMNYKGMLVLLWLHSRQHWKSPAYRAQLIPHLMYNFNCISNQRKKGLELKHMDFILDRLSGIASFIDDNGLFAEAVLIERFVFQMQAALLGDDHLDTLGTMNNLAYMLGHQGKMTEQALMCGKVLEKLTRVVGEDHPRTLGAMANFAQAIQSQGRLNEALPIQKKLLEKSISVLGKDHDNTLQVMQNIGSTLKEMDMHGEAVELYRTILEKRKQVLGKEDPITLSAMVDLATTLGNLNKLDEAALIFKKVLEASTRILGENHPDTIRSMNNFCSILVKQKRLDEAASIQQSILEKASHVLGQDHPTTIGAISNLSSTLKLQDKLDEAATMAKMAVEQCTSILGENHYDTLKMMSNLAIILTDLKRLDEAAAIHKTVFEKMSQLFGEEHSYTLSAMLNLASVLWDLERLDEAAAVYKTAVEKLTRLVGEDHQYTLQAKNDLAAVLSAEKQQKRQGAAGTSTAGAPSPTSFAWSSTWYGAAVPQGYTDVTEEVDLVNVDLLNVDRSFFEPRVLFHKSEPSGAAKQGQNKGKGSAGGSNNALGNSSATTDWIESDIDEQLMLFAPFRSHLRIHSLHITSLPLAKTEDDDSPMRPSTIRLFSNRTNVLGFEETADVEATQEIILTPDGWDAKTGTYRVDLRFVKFQNVTSLVVFIVDGDGHGDKVRIDRIRIFGEKKEKKDRPTWETVVRSKDSN